MVNQNLQYFDKKTGQSDHVHHIMQSEIRTNHSGGNTVDEAVALLIAEPTPVNYDSIPQSIRDNTNIIVDTEPTAFYHRWKLTFYIFGGFLLFFIVMGLGSLISLKFVVDSLEVSIEDIQILETTNDGVKINIENVDVNFHNPGIFNWIELMNETEIQFVDDIIITNEMNEQVFNISMNDKTLYFNVSKLHHWNFDLNDIYIMIEGGRFSYTLNNLTTEKTPTLTLNGKLKVSGKSIILSKSIQLKRNKLDGILDNFLPIVVDALSIQNIQIDNYDDKLGFTGVGDVSLEHDLLKNIQIPKLSSSIGFEIENVFYSLLSVDICKSTIIGKKNLIEFMFTLFNIDKRIINNGILDDIVWRFLNDDSEIRKFNFTVKGDKSNDIGWIHDMWENIELEMGMKIHSLLGKLDHEHYFESEGNYLNNLNLKTFNFGLDDNTGNLYINTTLSTLLHFYLKKYHILFDGSVDLPGITFSFDDLIIDKSNKKKTDISIGNMTVGIVDVEKSGTFIQNIIDHNLNLEKVPFEIESNIDILSNFFDGSLNVDGTMNADINTIIFKLLPKFERDSDRIVELVDVRYITGDSNYIKVSVDCNVNIPFHLDAVNNDIKAINIGINYGINEIFQVKISSFKGQNGVIPVNMEVILNSGNNNRREKIEEFIGEMLSGESTNITVNGINTFDDEKSIYGCDEDLCEFFENIRIPFDISSGAIIGEGDGESYFIRETIMHIISKEVEMTLFNPISNRNLIIEIEEGEAICEGYIIGYLKEKTIWEVESGIWKSPKVKVEYANTGSAGWKIIENAIRGDGIINNMTVRAVVKVYMSDSFGWKGLNILYKGTGHTNGKVRW